MHASGAPACRFIHYSVFMHEHLVYVYAIVLHHDADSQFVCVS